MTSYHIKIAGKTIDRSYPTLTVARGAAKLGVMMGATNVVIIRSDGKEYQF